MAKETTKSMRRRNAEKQVCRGLLWSDVFKGKGADIGAGDDPLPFDNCYAFDHAQGDANYLSQYIDTGSIDYLHASNCLEHMHNPEGALREWLKVVKPGGYLVITVPDLGLFENFTYPSLYNPDHKSSWSMLYKSSPFPIHVFIPEFLDLFQTETQRAQLVFTNYDWSQHRQVDQTWELERQVEMWNEFVLRKL